MNTQRVYIVLALHINNWQDVISVHMSEDEAAHQCQVLYNNKPFGIAEYVYEEHKLIK